MLFKFLEKPIEITAFVGASYTYVHDFSPIKLASNFFPDWMKKIPTVKNIKTINDYNNVRRQNVKQCVGILKTFQKGLVIPLWSDLIIETTENNYKYQFSDRISEIVEHTNQAPGFYENYQILKVKSPWLLKFSKNMDIIICQPFYMTNHELPYIIPYGINETLNNYCLTNFFLFCKRTENNFVIKQGTPMLHIIPLTEKKIKLKIEVLSDSDYLKIMNPMAVDIKFTGTGLTRLKISKDQKNG